MPCDCSHLEPTQREMESAFITEALKEVAGKDFSYKSPSLYYGDVMRLSEHTASLCSILDKMPPKKLGKLSLELQMWWRDHQLADLKKLRDAAMQKKATKVRQAALDKLTPEEKKALGLLK